MSTSTPHPPLLSCVHAERCPGCPWIARSYVQQLADKAARVRGALRGFPELVGIAPSATCAADRIEGYRARAKLVCDPQGSLGLFARGSHEVLDLPGCRVLDPALAEVAQALRGRPELAQLDGVDLARVGDAVMVTLLAKHDAQSAAFAPLADALVATLPAVESVAVSRRALGAVQLLGGVHDVLRGPRELRAQSAPDAPYHYAAPGAFQQVHPGTAQAILEQIATRIATHAGAKVPRVLELYAGSGALALALAARGMEVVAVESFAPACERLERAAREQRLAIEVCTGDAARVAAQFVARGAHFDAVVVNPPRRGLDVEVRRAIAALAPRRLAYVSCHPATLARDLAHLAREGLAVESLTPFDMIPLTEHVETLAWLAPAEPPLPELLYQRGPLLAVNKPPHEPTTPQGEHQRSLLARVQRLAGWERAVPLHRLDVGTSGVCLFSRTPEEAGELARALAAADKSYLALAKGITHKKGRVQKPLVEAGRSLAAHTRYVRERVVRGHSLLRVQIETGRKHQIRRHLVGIGHAVIGDGRYGDRATATHFAMRHGLDRPFLHCAAIALEISGERVIIEAPLAADLQLVLESLGAELNSAERGNAKAPDPPG